MKKQGIVIVVLLSFLFCLPAMTVYGQTATGYDTRAETEKPDGAAMIVDTIVVRPAGLAAIVIGAGISIVATPFALAGGNPKEVYGKLVGEPFDFTFRRPLGQGW